MSNNPAQDFVDAVRGDVEKVAVPTVRWLARVIDAHPVTFWLVAYPLIGVLFLLAMVWAVTHP